MTVAVGLWLPMERGVESRSTCIITFAQLMRLHVQTAPVCDTPEA